ncbi:MAG: T9SS type A sorting domain-containing protein [Bacteroidia bacterium]
MKKQLLTIMAAFATCAATAQTIKNGSFENWTNLVFEDPQYFMCANDESHNGKFYPATVTKTTDAYHGTYAIKLTSSLFGTDTAQAYVANGNPGSSITGGIPYNQMPTGIRFYYKNSQAPGDSSITLSIFKKNGSVIGQYVNTIGGNHSSYTLFTTSFNLTQIPDTVIFACASSNLMAHKGFPGSMIQIDSVSYTGVSTQPQDFNGDFELWQTVQRDFVVGWNGDQMSKTTDKKSGAYALELITNPPSFGDNQIRTGRCNNMVSSNGPPTGGWPYSSQIDTLVFYYKYIPAHFPTSNDSARFYMGFFKNGTWVQNTATFNPMKLLPYSLSFRKVEIPVNLSTAPDTVQISFESSNWPVQNSYVGSDLIVDQVYFKSQRIPIADFHMPTSGCKGVPIQLTDNSANMPTSWQWIMTGASPVNNTTVENPVIYYNNPGIYNISLQAADSFGTSSFITKSITIYNNPAVTATSATVCGGNSSSITAGGASTYTWSNGSTGANLVVTPTVSTTYTVTGTSAVGCSANATGTIFVPVTPAPDICMVTVDSASVNNVITWDKTLYNNVDSFIVYREVSTGVYKRIGAQHYSAFSQFTDTSRHVTPANGDPNIGSYRYKLQIRDTCGNYGAMGKYHNTVYITTNHTGAYNWNLYTVEGTTVTPVSTFDLLRDDNNDGTWHAIGFVSGNQFSLNDPSFSSYPNANWRVDANGFNCNPTFRAGNNGTQSAIIKSKSNITNNRGSGVKNNSTIVTGVYPNPSTGVFTIAMTVTKATADVYDLTGKKIQSFNLEGNTSQIDISGLSNGSYFLEITSEKGVHHQKINKTN